MTAETEELKLASRIFVVASFAAGWTLAVGPIQRAIQRRRFPVCMKWAFRVVALKMALVWADHHSQAVDF